MPTLPLFEDAVPPRRAILAEKLRRLAAENVWIGTSSWKYEGWIGQVYSRENYLARGRFSRKKFEETCLAEYAATFPIVCGDFSFYQFPSEQYWKKLFDSAPRTLRFGFKAPEDITVRVFPAHARYGARAGLENPSFLNADLFRQAFLEPLKPYGEQVAVLILEFGAFSRQVCAHAGSFVERLDRFLSALPSGFRYAVEVRNPEFLAPEYFACLREHQVAHVFNAWSRMPELKSQIAIREAFTANFTVTRALLRYGRMYEEAVRKFSPYQRVQEADPHGRQAMRELIRRARDTAEAAFVFVNNRFEGNAPETIEAVIEDE